MATQKIFNWKNIDKSWTLFLDRDGVINKKIPDAYITKWENFEFENGVLIAIKELSDIFNRIIIVTNQQGIQKGLMNEKQLEQLHDKMLQEIVKHGGKIDSIFYSPHLQGSNYYMRKPGVGMGVAAKKKYNDICFSKSVMAGDSYTDMLFGKRLGMKNVFINNNNPCAFNKIINLNVPKLIDFANILTK